MQWAVLMVMVISGAEPMRVEPEAITAQLAGKTIVVEGVFDSELGTGVERYWRLKGSDVRFQAGRHSLPGRGNLELIGQVRPHANRIVVEVNAVKALPPDLERFEAKARAIGADDARGWYELADWARQRAARRADAKLAEKATVAYRRGVEIQQRVAASEPEALETLKAKVLKDGRLPDFDVDCLDHDRLRAEYARVQAGSASELARFAERIGAELTLAEPAEPLAESLGRRYDADPRETFRRASDAERARLARYWQVLVLDRYYEQLAAEKDRSMLQIADLAAEQAPDYPAIAQKWYERAVEGMRASVGDVSALDVRGALQALVQKLRRPDQARELAERWLDHRYQQLKEGDRNSEGIGGPDLRARYDLVLRGLEWLGPSDPRVARLVEEILASDPDFPLGQSVEASTLNRAGYRQQADGRWSRRPADVVGPTKSAPLALQPGMTGPDVLALMGQPDRRAKLVTRNPATAPFSFSVRHQWIYRGPRETTYVVLDESSAGTPIISAIHSVK